MSLTESSLFFLFMIDAFRPWTPPRRNRLLWRIRSLRHFVATPVQQGRPIRYTSYNATSCPLKTRKYSMLLISSSIHCFSNGCHFLSCPPWNSPPSLYFTFTSRQWPHLPFLIPSFHHRERRPINKLNYRFFSTVIHQNLSKLLTTGSNLSTHDG